jgi:cytochrome c-type biogenesis protein CcmH/NrfG
MWRSRHDIAAQALRTAGKLHPDKKIAKAARAALLKAASARNSPRRG